MVLQKFAGALLALVFVGCQTAPTRVIETSQRPLEVLVDKAQRPIQLDEHTTVLDARPAFEYGLSRVANSLPFPWENLAENARTGELLRDPRRAELRLSLLGLEPQKPVLIIGQGLAGQGEEGRLAWNLLYLGFKDVQVASIDLFRAALTRNPSPPPANAPLWKSQPRAELLIDKETLVKLARDPKGRREARVFLIDVRSEKEYLRPAKSKKAPLDFQITNIEWRHFYTREGRPNPEIRMQFKALGIEPGDRVILLSQRGVRSGAAAYALMALGFQNVQNFVSGLQSL